MKTQFAILAVLLLLLYLFSSCGKGYEVRVTNYNIEDMDSVSIGDKVVFENIARQNSTEYKKIGKGTYTIKVVTKSKKRLGFSITIPNRKSGKRTVQIDGQGTISVLQD